MIEPLLPQLEIILQEFTILPKNRLNTWYHFTNRAGLEGILTSGTLRAMHRCDMSDSGEMTYALGVIRETLREIEVDAEKFEFKERLLTYVRVFLDALSKDAKNLSNAYCACLTLEKDESRQWDIYAERSSGYAIGLSAPSATTYDISNVLNGKPHTTPVLVLYDIDAQRTLVKRLFHRTLHFIEAIPERYEQDKAYSLGQESALDLVAMLFVAQEFMKDEKYSYERELRLIQNPNDGTLKPSVIQKDGERSFIPLDLRDPITGLMPITEIIVGINADFDAARTHVESILEPLGYLESEYTTPRIIRSSV